MSPDRPFNSLGQILAAGGEIAVGRLLAAGASSSQIEAFIFKRFGPIEPADKDQLVNLATEMVDAGTAISALPDDAAIQPSEVPTIPELFGDQTEGQRLLYVGQYRIPGTDKWFNTSGTFPDVPDKQALLDQIAEQGSKNINTSPKKHGAATEVAPEDLEVQIILAGKAF